MLVPLIAAVPLGEAGGPPLTAKCAPGSREFLNCCPFTETAEGGADGLRWLTALFGTLVATFETVCSSGATPTGVSVRGVFLVGVFAGRS